MARLPNTEDVASDIVMPRTYHRDYDHALQGTGDDDVNAGRFTVNPMCLDDEADYVVERILATLEN